MTEDQIQDEIDAMIDYVNYLYERFGVTPRAEPRRARTRLGTDEQWDAEAALEAALKRHGLEYVISPGEGTFYGPKIDLHMTDVLGRSWQMGTIQLDYQMPVQFGLTYMGADNREHSPVVIHRALLGSLERFGDSHRALRGRVPSGSRPSRCASCPSGSRIATPRERSPRGPSPRGFAPTWTSVTRRSASGFAMPSSRRSPFVVVYGDRESRPRSPCASGGGQSTRSLDERLETFRALAAEADPQGQTSV